jgi:hypothetical protein
MRDYTLVQWYLASNNRDCLPSDETKSTRKLLTQCFHPCGPLTLHDGPRDKGLIVAAQPTPPLLPQSCWGVELLSSSCFLARGIGCCSARLGPLLIHLGSRSHGWDYLLSVERYTHDRTYHQVWDHMSVSHINMCDDR